MKKQILPDADFGRIILVTRRTARNLSMRPKEDGLYVITPPYRGITPILAAIEPYRLQLLKLREKILPPPFSRDFRIDTDAFHLYMESYEGKCIRVADVDEKVCIRYPHLLDFAQVSTQRLIRSAIERALRKRAIVYLSQLLDFWSKRVELPYTGLKITKARTRWGSCSSKKQISLSYYLMLLPSHLIDYVILHELAHTQEMNHGPAFWALLDDLTEGRSQCLRKELRNFRPVF